MPHFNTSVVGTEVRPGTKHGASRLNDVEHRFIRQAVTLPNLGTIYHTSKKHQLAKDMIVNQVQRRTPVAGRLAGIFLTPEALHRQADAGQAVRATDLELT